MSSSAVISEAKKWIDGLADGTGMRGSWRLETIGKKYRYQINPESGRRRRIPIRIRRFASGIPWSLVFEAIKYLESQAPYVGFLFNGVRVDTPYRPTQTFWRRDDSSDDGQKSQGTYTLIQDLIEDGCDDLCSIPTSSSCSEVVTTDWVWDASTPGDLPQSEQGVTYSLQSVHRKDDGTFDYALVKRTAITQFSPETVVSSDLEADVTQEVWDNLYGTPDAYLNHRGEPIAGIAQDKETGESVTVDSVKNSDCTYKVTVRRRVAKPFNKAVSERHTLFSDDVSTTTTALKERPSTAVSRDNGTVVTVDVEASPDGTFTSKETVQTERQVPDAVTETRMTRHGVVVTKTNRSAQSPAPFTASVGRTVRNERTDGGLWNQVITTPARTGAGVVRHESRSTAFESTSSRTSNSFGGVQTVDSSAANGTMTSRVSDLTDTGTHDLTVTTVIEHAYPDAATDHRVTPHAVVTTRTHRNQRSRAKAPGSESPVGHRIVNEVTPGGAVNQTITSITPRIGACDQSYCESDTFQTVASTTKVKGTALDLRQVTTSNTKVKKGVVRRVDRSVSEDGVLLERIQDTTEKDVEDAVREVHATATAIVSTVTHRNQSTAKVTSSDQVQLRPGESIKSEKTPGGNYTNTITSTASRNLNCPVHTVSEITAFRTTEEATVVSGASPEELGLTFEEPTVQSPGNSENPDDPDPNILSVAAPTVSKPQYFQYAPGKNLQNGVPFLAETVAGGGTITRTETKLEDTGLVSVTTRTTKEHPTLVRRELQKSKGVEVVTTEYVASSRPADTDISTETAAEEAIRRNVSYSVTDGGLFRVVDSTTTYKSQVTKLPDVDTGYYYCEKTLFSHLPESRLRELYAEYTTRLVRKFNSWVNSDRGPNEIKLDPVVSYDESTYTFSGHIAFHASWLPEQAGTSGSVEKTFYSIQYTSEQYAGSFTLDGSNYVRYTVQTMVVASGRGLNSLQSHLSGNGSVSFSYNPRSSTWSVTKCVKMETRTEQG